MPASPTFSLCYLYVIVEEVIGDSVSIAKT